MRIHVDPDPQHCYSYMKMPNYSRPACAPPPGGGGGEGGGSWSINFVWEVPHRVFQV